MGFHTGNSECTIKYPHKYDPVFGSAIELNSDNVASLLYMIQSGYYDDNVGSDDILSLLGHWNAQEYIFFLIITYKIIL